MNNGGFQLYRRNRSWADQYNEQIRAIVGRFMVQEADDRRDMEEATDLMVFRLQPATIASRVRRLSKYFGKYKTEFTIRTRRPDGRRTEFAKIMDGFADYYFYGWVDEAQDRVVYWTIFDLEVFRQAIQNDSTLSGQEVTNPSDGITFTAFDFTDFPHEMVLETNLPGFNRDAVSGRVYFEDGAA